MAAPLLARFGTRQVLAVEGPDAATYLQGQLSQDILALGVDDSDLSLVLSPQGKVDAWVRVTRIAEATFWVDVEAGFGEPLQARLKRFLLRTDAAITLGDLQAISFRCATDDAAALMAIEANQLPDDHFRVLPALGWPQPGVDVIGDGAELRALLDRISAVDELDDEGWRRLRIRSGVPAMGAELVEDTIPATAGIVDDAVSFTKGCYTGQELVARIDSRGNKVPRILCMGRAAGPAALGAEITDDDGDTIGTVTSSASDPTELVPDQTVVLAYVRRGVELPLDANVGTIPIALRHVGSGP